MNNNLNEGDLDDDMNELYEIHFEKLERLLKKHRFLITHKVTIIDVVIFCDVYTVVRLYEASRMR